MKRNIYSKSNFKQEIEILNQFKKKTNLSRRKFHNKNKLLEMESCLSSNTKI